MNAPAAIVGGIAALALAAGGTTAVVMNQTGSSGCGYTICAGTTGQSFAAAVQAASPGDTITVEPGVYPAQSILSTSTKPAPAISFVGNGATVGAIDLGTSTTCNGGQNLSFSDFKLTGAETTRCGAAGITFTDMTAASFNLSGGSNISVLGGSYGPKVNDVNQLKGGVSGVVIDGIYAHDFTINDPAKHAECLHIWGAKNFTVRNSVFQNCTDRDIFAKREGGLIIDGGLVENNQFDVPMPGNVATVTCNPTCPRGGNSVQFSQSGGQITNSVITNNRALSAFSNEGQPGVVMSGNIFSGFIPPTNSGTFTKLSLVLPGDTPPPTTTTTTTTTEPTTTSTTTTETTTTTDTTTDTTTTAPPPDSLPLTVVAQTATTVTVGWTPAGDQGYRFLVDGVSVSNTNDSTRSSARFSRKAGAVIKVIARSEVASGTVVSP